MNYYDLAVHQIDEGKKLKKRFNNKYLPSLSSCINGVQKGRYYLIGADPGVGKTTLADQMFVLDILLDLYETQSELDVEIHYWSLELAVEVKILKLLSYKLWIEYCVSITPDLITDKSLDPRIEKVIKVKYKKFLDFVQTKVTFYDEATVKEIDDTLSVIAKNNGSVINGKYVEHNVNKLIIILIDHVGLIKGPGDVKTKIEFLSVRLVRYRNICHFTPVLVQQFNRTANSVERQKFNPAPQRDDFKDTSVTYEAADVAIGIVNPASYGKDSFKDYDLSKFTKSSFRSIHVMKNRYGRFPASSAVGLQGVSGWLYELPGAMTDQDYLTINTYKSLHKDYVQKHKIAI